MYGIIDGDALLCWVLNLTMKYSASFTAAALLFEEINALADILASEERDVLLKEEIKLNQRIQVNSEKARKRKISEIKNRSKQVDKKFWEHYLSRPNENERRLLLFYLALKTYALLFDFHFDVTVLQWKNGNTEINPYYYTMKFNELEADNEEIANWSDSTKEKVISRYQTMLRQAKLIEERTIRVPQISDSFWCYFVEQGDTWFLEACFLKQIRRQQLMTTC